MSDTPNMARLVDSRVRMLEDVIRGLQQEVSVLECDLRANRLVVAVLLTKAGGEVTYDQADMSRASVNEIAVVDDLVTGSTTLICRKVPSERKDTSWRLRWS